MEKHKRSFRCVDANGETYVVHEFVEIIQAGHMADRHATLEGLGRLVLEDGSPVNDKGDGTFQSVRTGMIIRPL